MKLTRLEATSLLSSVEEMAISLRNRFDDDDRYVNPAIHYEEIHEKLRTYLDQEFYPEYYLSKYDPTIPVKLKPLTALIDAEQDCRKIYEFAIGRKCTQIIIEKDYINMHAAGEVGSTVRIYFNGFIRASQIFHVKQGNMFALIDYIRKLGYEYNRELL